MQCKSQQKIDTHHTRDAASLQAANGPLRVALFRPGSRGVCKCQAEDGVDPADCDALYVMDSDGAHIATFHGSEFRAADEENSGGAGLSGLCVYKMPMPTRDKAECCRSMLTALNRRNAAFWQRRNAEE